MIFILIVVTLVLVVTLSFRNSKDKELAVENYLPNSTMIKHFAGGFENEGFTHSVREIGSNEVQIIQADTGAMVMLKYSASANDIRLLSAQVIDLDNPDESEATYIDKIVIKKPLEVGTKWTDESGYNYEITSVNSRVLTRMGFFYAIEVTIIRGEYEVKEYYAKNIGLIKRAHSHGNDIITKIKGGL